MICNIPQIEAWTSHLISRAEEAREIGLLAKNDKLAILSAVVFSPDSIDKTLLELAQPNSPLREIRGLEKPHGWVKRGDLFDDAAKWVLDKYSNLDGIELFCEAGYSKQGDKVLESRQHILFGDTPFLNWKLSEASPEKIAETLRFGRSWRLLGVIADMSNDCTFADSEIKRFSFICDAFDGDSILVVGLNCRSMGPDWCDN